MHTRQFQGQQIAEHRARQSFAAAGLYSNVMCMQVLVHVLTDAGGHMGAACVSYLHVTDFICHLSISSVLNMAFSLCHP